MFLIAILLLALPIPVCLCGRRFVPRWLALGITLVVGAYGGLLSVAAISLVGVWLASSPGDCLQRMFFDGAQSVSPDGRYRAVVSSGVCVTGLSSVNSYDGVDVEVETVATGDRVPVLKAEGGAGVAPRVHWLDGRRLSVTVHRPLAVLTSKNTAGNVTVKFQVPRTALASPDPRPAWFDSFTKWADEHSVSE